MESKRLKKRNILTEGGIASDITKSGPLTYLELQALNRKLFEDENSGLSTEYRKGLEEDKDLLFTPFTGTETLHSERLFPNPIPEGQVPIGESRFDDFSKFHSVEDLYNAADIRAENQPWWSQILNGIGKSVVTAGTSFLDAYGGLGLGLIEMPIYAIKGADAATVVSRLWDNEFSHAMKAVQDWSEKVMPNYYTQAELDDPWYKHINANFIGDKVIKNLGFTAGMIGAGATGAGILNVTSRAIQAARGVQAITGTSRLVANVTGSALAGLNEARTEALQNAESYRQDASVERGDQLDQECQMALDALKEEMRGRLSDLENNYSGDKPHDIKRENGIEYSSKTGVGKSTLTDTTLEEYLQERDALQQEYQRRKKDIEDYYQDAKDKMQSKIDHDAIRLGNVIMAVEAPMIMATDAIAWGSVFSRGYATHTGANIIMHHLPKGVAAGLTFTGEAISEGGQEWLQDLTANIAEKYYDSALDDFYTARFDPDSEERTMNILKACAEGWNETVNSPDSWESFFIGSLTKVTGVVMPRTYRNSQGKLRIKPSFEGNIYTDTKEYLQQLRERDALEQRAIKDINNNNLIQSIATALQADDYYARQQESFANPTNPPAESSDFLRIFKKKVPKEVLKEGSNKFNYENASHKRLLNLITLYSKLGRINELKERVSAMADNLTDADIDGLVKNTTAIYTKDGKLIKEENIKGQEVIYKGPFVDEQGNRLSNDEIRQALQDKKQTIFNTIDQYRKIAKAVDLRYGGRLNIDDLQEVVWLESQLQNWGDRVESMAGDIKSVIDDALGVIQEDVSALQTIIDSTEEGSKEHKQAVKDLESTQVVYNNLMKFRDMSEKKLARKLSLRQDIHGNLDNSAYSAVLTIFEAINNLKKTGDLSEKYNEQDLNDILIKLQDLVVLGKLRQAFMAKLSNYLSKPTEVEKKKLEEQKKAQERKDADVVKKIKESLSRATSLAEFRRVVANNNEDPRLIQKAINELEKEGNSRAKNYKRTSAYRNAVLKAIDNSNVSDEEKQDAKTIFNDHYGNAENIDELADPEYREAESTNSFRTVNAGTTGLGRGAHVRFTDASGKEVTGTIVNSDAERGDESGFVFVNDSDPDNPEFVSWQEAQRGKITNIQTPEETLNKRYAKASTVLRDAKREVNARDEWKSLFSTPQPNPGYTGNTSGKTSSSIDGSDPIDPVNPETTPIGTQKDVGTTIPVGGESASKEEANKKRDRDNREFDTQQNEKDGSARANDRNSENNRPYYRPCIPYHDLAMLAQQKVVRFIDVKADPEKWKLLWDYLAETTHAFNYVDEGNLHEGDEIGFMIDPQYEADKQASTTYGENKNIPTIFMVTKDGQVVGSLDENLTEKFQGLTELRQQIEEEYNKNKDKLGKNEKFTSVLKTHVNQMMTGHLSYNYDESDPNKERSLAVIPGVMDSSNPILGIMKGGVLDTNGALEGYQIVTPVNGEDGALYLMVPTGAGVYIPSRVTVAHFNKNEFNLNDATVRNTPLGSRIYDLLDQLLPNSEKPITSEVIRQVMSDLNNVIFTRDILLNYEERDDGIYLKFGHKVYDENGNPVLTDNGIQRTDNEYVKLADKIPVTVTQLDSSQVTSMATSWRIGREEVFNEILEKFYSFNVPIQVSVKHINKVSGKNSYNARLISSGVLTSNLISAEQQGQGTWFTVNPIVNGKEIKGTAPRKLGTTAAAHQNNTIGATEANPLGGTDSATPRSWIPITLVNTGKVYNVDMNTGKIYDAAGKEAILSPKNISLLRDLAKANQLYGNNTEGASMAGNIMIIEDSTSPYSVGSYRVLDRTTQTYLTGEKAQEVINKILGINPTQAETTTPEDKTPQTKNSSVEVSIYDNSIETLNPIDSSEKIEIDGNELPNGRVGYFVIKQNRDDPQDLGRVHKGIIYDLGEKGNTGLHVGIVKVTSTQQVQADIGGGEMALIDHEVDTYYAVFPNGETFAIVSGAVATSENVVKRALEQIARSSEAGTVQLSNTKTAITEFFENYKQNPENQETTKEGTPQEGTTKETTTKQETAENAEQPAAPPVTQGTAANENDQSVDEWLDETEDDEDPEIGDYKTGEREDTTTSPLIDGNTLNPDFVPEVGHEYGIEAAEAVFNQEIGNSRKARATKMLANKVFAIARKLGIKIIFDNSLTINNPGRYNANGTIVFSHRFFTRIKTSDKANIILHEIIHACTQYVLSDKMKGELNKPENKNLKEAVDILNETYAELKANKKLSGQYGMTNVKEMVAEMSNPEFRQALKKASLWEKFKAGIKRLLGIKTSDNNYTKISVALSTILDNYNPALYEVYVKANEVQEAEEISNLVRWQLKRDLSLVKFYNWYKTNPIINKRGEKETRITKKGQKVERRIVDLVEGVSTEAGIDHLNALITELVDSMFTYCKSIKTQIAPRRVRTEMAALIVQDEKVARQFIRNINRLYPDALLQFHRDVSAYTDDELLLIKETLQETLDSLRRQDIEEWQNKINELSANGKVGEITPAEKYTVVTSLIQFCENTSETSLIKFLEPQVIATLNKMRERSSLDSPFNFYKSYVKTLGEGMGDPNTEVIEVKAKTGLSGKWVRINNERTSTNINQSVAKLQALSRGTNWCTKSSTRANHVLINENRSFYCFIPNGQTTAYVGVVPIKVGEDINKLQGHYAGIFNKDQSIGNNVFDINALEAIETLCKETNDPNVKYTLESLGYSGLTKEEKEALEQKREALKQEQRKIFQGLKDKEEFSIEDAENLNKLGFPVICHENKIGLSALTRVVLDNIKNLSSREKQDIINKLLHSPTFTFIEDDLVIGKTPESHSPIQDIGNVEYVGGNVNLKNISISPKLKRIDGNVTLRTSNLLNIEYVGGYLDIHDSKLVSLGNLRYIGGSLLLPNTIKSLGKLTYIGDNLDISSVSGDKLFDFGELETVGGNLRISESSYRRDVNLKNLKRVGGYFSCSYIKCDAPHLEFVGKSCRIDRGNLESLRYIGGNAELGYVSKYLYGAYNTRSADIPLNSLTYIGGDAILRTNTQKLDNLEFVGGFLSLEAPNVQKLHKDLIVEKALIFINPTKEQREDTFLEDFRRGSNTSIIGLNIGEIEQLKKIQNLREDLIKQLNYEEYLGDVGAFDDDELLFEQEKKKREIIEAEFKMADIWGIQHLKSVIAGVTAEAINNQTWNNLSESTRQRLREKGYNASMFRLPQEFISHIIKCCGV